MRLPRRHVNDFGRPTIAANGGNGNTAGYRALTAVLGLRQDGKKTCVSVTAQGDVEGLLTPREAVRWLGGAEAQQGDPSGGEQHPDR
jgi:hypothetical protein